MCASHSRTHDGGCVQRTCVRSSESPMQTTVGRGNSRQEHAQSNNNDLMPWRVGRGTWRVTSWPRESRPIRQQRTRPRPMHARSQTTTKGNKSDNKWIICYRDRGSWGAKRSTWIRTCRKMGEVFDDARGLNLCTHAAISPRIDRHTRGGIVPSHVAKGEEGCCRMRVVWEARE